MSLLKALGKNPTGKRLAKILKSPNYSNKAFQNLSHTEQLSKDSSFFKIAKDSMNKSKNVVPSKDIPFVKTDLKNITSDEPVIVWFGHSSYFIRINGKNILIDPVFSGNASPFSFMIKAFKGSDNYTVDDLPEIDLLLLTHDHYDHLDYKTITELIPKVKQVYCALGVGSHLEYWGMKEDLITEFDWWDKNKFYDMEVIAAPGRHFSGRTVVRSKVLWCSFILKTSTHTLFLGGDSGYDSHFKTIGDKYGPFDIALLECGQYNTSWPNIHMMPEETVQASIDLKAKVLFPIHWAKFSLAMHDWDESIKRVIKKAGEQNTTITTPKIGEPVVLGQSLPKLYWWEF